VLLIGAGFVYARVLFDKPDAIEVFVFTSLFALHPFNTEFYTFSDVTLIIMLAIFLAAVGLACANAGSRTWIGPAVGGLLLVLSASIYQTAFVDSAVVSLLCLVGRIPASGAATTGLRLPLRYASIPQVRAFLGLTAADTGRFRPLRSQAAFRHRSRPCLGDSRRCAAGCRRGDRSGSAATGRRSLRARGLQSPRIGRLRRQPVCRRAVRRPHPPRTLAVFDLGRRGGRAWLAQRTDGSSALWPRLRAGRAPVIIRRILQPDPVRPAARQFLGSPAGKSDPDASGGRSSFSRHPRSSSRQR